MISTNRVFLEDDGCVGYPSYEGSNSVCLDMYCNTLHRGSLFFEKNTVHIKTKLPLCTNITVHIKTNRIRSLVKTFYGFDITDLNFYKCFFSPNRYTTQRYGNTTKQSVNRNPHYAKTKRYANLVVHAPNYVSQQAVAEPSLLAVLLCDR